MQPQMQNQPQQKKAPDAVQYSDLTLFFCPFDQFEREICQKYVTTTYPNTRAGFVWEIPVDKLAEDIVIIPIFRCRANGMSEAWITDHHTNGTESLRRAPLADLAKEVVEAPPIYCKDHWKTEQSNGVHFGRAFQTVKGVIDVRGIHRAVNERLRDPVSIQRWRKDMRILMIGP